MFAPRRFLLLTFPSLSLGRSLAHCGPFDGLFRASSVFRNLIALHRPKPYLLLHTFYLYSKHTLLSCILFPIQEYK